MHRFSVIGAFVALLVCSPWALAWNPTGHRAIAAIAYDQLTAPRRQELVALLKDHPRFHDDFEALIPAGLSGEATQQWIFMHAAAWPDTVRDLKGDDLKLYNRPVWHYIDLPVFLDEAAVKAIHPPKMEFDYHKAVTERTMNAVQALHKALDTFNDQSQPRAQRAVALCWVLHLVGDLHQPLHGATLYSAERFREIPLGDKGGNSIKVRNPDTPEAAGTQTESLHWFWDCLLGIDDTYAGAIKVADDLMHDFPISRFNSAQLQASPEQWALESNRLADEKVYSADIRRVVSAGEANPHTPLPLIELTKDYVQSSRKIVRQRAVLGAYRLAALLAPAKMMNPIPAPAGKP